MEDLAYRRMLDLYYRTEKALPTDWREIARLIRMRDQVDAIQSVLREFFELTDLGWISARCEAEITKMQDRQASADEKAAHETDRMRRHRERRAQMFNDLREAGVVPAWDVPMKELQQLWKDACNAPETRTAALPETDVQRLSLPTPIPIPVEKAARATRLPTDWVLPDDWEEWARTERPDLDPTSVACSFRDYWVAKPGKDGRKTDWLATWRNWVRNQRSMSAQRGGNATSIWDGSK